MTSHRFDVFNTNVKILVNFPRKTTDHQQTTNQSGIYRNKPKSRNETTNTTLTSLTHQDPCQNKPDQDQERLSPLTTIVSDHFCLTSRCSPLAWRPRGRPLQVSHGRVSDGSSVGFMTGSSTSRRIDNESTMKGKPNQIPITRWVLDLRSRRSPRTNQRFGMSWFLGPIHWEVRVPVVRKM